jgi:hypothetical protein
LIEQDTNKPHNGNPDWVKGGPSPNPAGRPKGSRNKLAEDFLSDLREAWQQRGKSAISDLSSDQLCNVVVKTLPKEMTLEVGETFTDLLRRADELLAQRSG